MNPPQRSSKDPSPETLVGLVDRVTFHNPQTGFAVLRVERRGPQDVVTVVGKIASVLPGEEIRAVGRWGVDPTHGSQFQAETLQTARPSTLSGVVKYLGSGAVKGIGPKTAEKIVGCFGDKIGRAHV